MGWGSSNRAGTSVSTDGVGDNRGSGGLGVGKGGEGRRTAAGRGLNDSGGGGGPRGVHPDCAVEFVERFVRRDIALAGRAQAVRLLNER